MCLITFSYQSHPRYRLIMVANRDEFYQRPTEPAHFWHDDPNIFAGRDSEAGGTWLGLHKSGRLAAVTNFREGKSPQKPDALSRGELVTDFLQGTNQPLHYAQSLQDDSQNYNGFNLLLADKHSLVYCSNRSDQSEELTPGIYTLSNHLLNTPWPKAQHAKSILNKLVNEDVIHADRLASCLSRRDPFPDDQLPSTGIELYMERALSSPFIVTPGYGTRCTTTLLWANDGEVELVEQNYLPNGEKAERKRVCLNLPE